MFFTKFFLLLYIQYDIFDWRLSFGSVRTKFTLTLWTLEILTYFFDLNLVNICKGFICLTIY